MNFLIDAQLPAQLAEFLNRHGHDAIHTRTLPRGNGTPDAEITKLADTEQRVVVSKDRDFREGHIVRQSPQRLLVVATGNITNDALVSLFET